MEKIFNSLEEAIGFQKSNAYVNLCFYNNKTQKYHMIAGVAQQQQCHSNKNFVYIKTDFEK